MSFMDRVRAQAEQAVVKAQQGVAQGQTKLDEIQTKRAGDALIASLGSAYYAQQRQDGPADAVARALAAVDAHVAAHGPLGGGSAPPQPGGPPPTETPSP